MEVPVPFIGVQAYSNQLSSGCNANIHDVSIPYSSECWLLPRELILLRRNFLWEGNCEKKKLHLVKRDSLVISKKDGGFGEKNIKVQNQSLMMKWLWRFASIEHSLWKEVIREKYGMEEHWTINMVSEPSLWSQSVQVHKVSLARIQHQNRS